MVGGKDSVVFHPVLVHWPGSDYQQRYGPGRDFHAATMVKCLWYARPVPSGQQKSKAWAQQKRSKRMHWSPLNLWWCVLTSQPHAMIDHTCVMCLCVLCSLPGRVSGCEIRSLCHSALQSRFRRYSYTICLSSAAKKTKKTTTPSSFFHRLWPCYRSFHTPSPALPITSSLPLIWSFSGASFCVIKSRVVPLLYASFAILTAKLKIDFFDGFHVLDECSCPPRRPYSFHSPLLATQLHIDALSDRLQPLQSRAFVWR